MADADYENPMIPEIAELYKNNRIEHDNNARLCTQKYAM